MESDNFDIYLEANINLTNKSKSEYKSALRRIFKKLNIDIYSFKNIKEIERAINNNAFIQLNRKEGHVYSAAIGHYIQSLDLKETLLSKEFKSNLNLIQTEDSQLKSLFIEGKKIAYYGTKYERDSKLRQQAIKIHGVTCKVCEFNFENKYGLLGKDFIEIHHLKPLYLNSSTLTPTNPRTDLIPVCSNCHRMIHRKKGCLLSVEELKNIITQ